MPFSYDEMGTYRETLRSREEQERADEELIFGEYRKPRSEIEILADEMVTGSLRRLSPVLQPILQESIRVAPYVWELMSQKSPQRKRAVRRPPYRDLTLAERFLEESAKIAARLPGRSEELAQMAEWIAELPWPGERKRAVRIQADACIAQAEARRSLRDWQGAELKLSAAYALLKQEPAGWDHALFCQRLSELREDQGRLHEAAVLLQYSMQLHCFPSPVGNLLPDGIVHLAFLALKQNQPGWAMTLFTQLCLEEEETLCLFRPMVEIHLGQAVCLAALGLHEEARRLTEECQPGRQIIAERDRQLPLEWLECRIAVHLGDLDRAIPRLEALHRWLVRDRDLPQICLCSLDLALAYAKKGQAAERLPDLLREIARHKDAALQPWALGSLWWFQEAVEQKRDLAIAVKEAAEIVHRRERCVRRLGPEATGAPRDPGRCLR
jgi:hypothetical protein